MPFNRLTAMLATAVAPMLWGTTYLVFTQTLPVDHPLLVGALRALPAGVLLMLLGPGLPPRDKLLPLLLLGLANIGVFFALLFVAAQRLPGVWRRRSCLRSRWWWRCWRGRCSRANRVRCNWWWRWQGRWGWGC
ncbi:eamA-like transporter family protein [Ralstonia insidiosa]|uniref:EamA-like transporter family protein n=1 Tax=Ralstonia insidiosa TaxID=190721 RepID=A0AAC9BCV7_9RALS|nr:eamA-like transporter family protein [Ralstonia insidiosa]